jgi:hypothetical protein
LQAAWSSGWGLTLPLGGGGSTFAANNVVTPPNPPLGVGRLEAAQRERDEKRENDGAAVRTLCVVYICGSLIR